MAENTSANKQRLKEITDGIEQGIQDLFQSDRYAQYLSTMSRFHKYSLNNTILIYQQRPDATLCCGFGKWRDQFGRHVKKGEKGIQIIAPTPFKKKIEMEKLDPDTKAPMLNANGTVVIEEKVIQIPMYKPVYVYDIGQTEGKPLPTLAADLTGNVERYDFFLEALRRSSPVPIEFEAMCDDMDGYFSVTDQRIAIREGMSEVLTVAAAVHEITHSKLHNYEQERLAVPIKEGAEPPAPKDRRTEEVEADSVAYSLCRFFGLETGENSFGYILTWSSDKTLPELRASLETINKTASGLISDIDFHFREVVKEYDVVIEQFAADCDTYVRENPGNSLLLANREESIEQMVEEIKAGNGIYVYTDIIVAAQNVGAASPDELLRRYDEIEKNYPERETEAVYLLDNETYLHIHELDKGVDYIMYDKGLREIDGGYIDTPDISLDDAYTAVLEIHELYPESSEKVSLDILDEIAAVLQQDIDDYLRNGQHIRWVTDIVDQPLHGEQAEPASGQMSEAEQWESDHITDFTVTEQAVKQSHPMPEAPEQAYYYPMPDPDLSVEDLENCGYMDGDMLPLSKDRALELYEKDLTIYMIYDDGEASMAFDTEEIKAHSGIFAVPYDEWELVKNELAPTRDEEVKTLNEQAFIDTSDDAYAIYQVKHGEPYRDYRFESYDRLQSAGLAIDKDNYSFIYAANLTENGTTDQKLENLYQQFNVDHPADFKGHSLSVSDILALKQDGNVTYHYCDRIGFMELPGFNSGRNPLRSVEDIIEQNDNQLDGIINNVETPSVAELEAQAKSGQPISLTDLARAVKEENREKHEKRPSVLAKLRQPLPQTEKAIDNMKKTAPQKSADLER